MTGGSLVRARLIRRLSLLLALLAGLGVLWLFNGPRMYTPGFAVVGSLDLVAYWSAARLLLRGADPYDGSALLPMMQAAGWPWSEPVGIWNPPWTLVVVLPLALLPFGLATQVWYVLQLGLILGSGLLLWRYFAPEDSRYWIGPLLAAVFVPGLDALIMGQISSWLLTGVVAFLCAERSRQDLLAGSALAPLMMKPHVAYLFLPAALWWAWRSRRWRVIIGWLAALMGASAIVLLFAPDIFASYSAAVAAPPLQWDTPTLGLWLKVLFGREQRWLQFLPSLVGALGLALWMCRRRGPWDWSRVAAPLLLASALTAGYGWSSDQVVLLPVLVAAVARLRLRSRTSRAAGLAAWAMSQLGLMIRFWWKVPEVLFIWHPFVLAGLYWWTASRGPAAGVGDAPRAGNRGGCAWGT